MIVVHMLAFLVGLIRHKPSLWLWLVGAAWLCVYGYLASDGNISAFRIAPPRLLEYGAAYGPALAAGEYWRLLAAPWLHGTLPHVIYSAAMLWLLGGIASRQFGPGASFAVFAAGLAAGFGLGLLVHGDQYLMVGGWGGLSALAGLVLAHSFVHRKPGWQAGLAFLHLLLISTHGLVIRQLAQIGFLPQLICFLLGVAIGYILLRLPLSGRGLIKARWVGIAFMAGLPLFAGLERLPESERWPGEIKAFDSLYRFEAGLLAAGMQIDDVVVWGRQDQEAVLQLDMPVLQAELVQLGLVARDIAPGRLHDRLAAAQDVVRVLIASIYIYRMTGPQTTAAGQQMWKNMQQNQRTALRRYFATYYLGK